MKRPGAAMINYRVDDLDALLFSWPPPTSPLTPTAKMPTTAASPISPTSKAPYRTLATPRRPISESINLSRLRTATDSTSLSRKGTLVRARTLDRRNVNIQQSEIDRKPAAMVVPVIQHQGSPDTHSWHAPKLLLAKYQTPVRFRRSLCGLLQSCSTSRMLCSSAAYTSSILFGIG